MGVGLVTRDYQGQETGAACCVPYIDSSWQVVGPDSRGATVWPWRCGGDERGVLTNDISNETAASVL